MFSRITWHPIGAKVVSNNCLLQSKKPIHRVNAARNAKLARLKQAKEEAEKEVAAYRAQVEFEFQKKLEEVE